jgi:hypothetical protein
MEPVIIIRDRKNNHRLMQIDLDLLAKNEELLEAVYNMIAIEVGKKEKAHLSKQTKQQLNKQSKLQNGYRIELKNPYFRN